jgi:hypothetical protein
MTDGDKIAAAVMAAGLCSKGNANPDEYVQHYFEILQKMSQQEGAAQQRRWNAPRASAFWFAERDLTCGRGTGCQSLFLVALLLDNAGLGRILEIATGRDKGAPRNEDGDLRPRTVGILFEGIAGYFSEARGI